MAEFMNLGLVEGMRVQRIYDDYVDAFEKYDNEKFRRRFRLGKNAVNDLTNLLENDLRRVSHRRCTITPEMQVLLALRYYGGNSMQLLTGDSLHVSQPAACKAISAVSKALSDRVYDFIRLPAGDDARKVKRGFHDVAGFPGVVSCIDGTHVRITAPKQNEEQFVNRKKYHSVNVQAACDHEFNFTNLFVKWTGGTHDSFILQDSELWNEFETNHRDGIILADSGYPCRYWLMTPFLSPTTAAQRYYNDLHKRTRCRIEMAFGQLKRRFNLLHQENRRKVENVVSDTAACFMLHNYAKSVNDPLDFDDLVGGEDYDIPDNRPAQALETIGGQQRRIVIANRLYQLR